MQGLSISAFHNGKHHVLRCGWWKPWTWSSRTWLLAFLGLTAASPFACRWINLWQVPDVAVPIDVATVF